MKTYGYIQNGVLQATYLSEYSYNTCVDGKIIEQCVSIEEQAARLSPEWKPVDDIDFDRMHDCSESEIVVPIPYDAGDHIAYRYENTINKQRLIEDIEYLKQALASSDYQIIKCYESYLVGDALPYDVTELHAVRQDIRDRINNLQDKLSSAQ